MKKKPKIMHMLVGLVLVLFISVAAFYFFKTFEMPVPDQTINLTVRVIQEDKGSGTGPIIFSSGITSIDFNVSVNVNDDIFYLKKLVYFKTKVPVESQKLTYKGQELKVGKALYEYEIDGDSRIHLVLL
jgi:hypothetical protein